MAQLTRLLDLWAGSVQPAGKARGERMIIDTHAHALGDEHFYRALPHPRFGLSADRDTAGRFACGAAMARRSRSTTS